ncbi:MAG: lipopolysaccharide biosynthesis protein [Planctomycetota bacterium]|jgi:O-antigen/teichoic acid export membrane protein
MNNANDLRGPDNNLLNRTAKGGLWVFSLRTGQRILQIIKLVILARLLNPADFGLMGIALLTIAVLETFSQTGFQNALIQKKCAIKSYLDTAWTVSILRGFILFAILYLIAPYTAIFFKVPEARLIIQVIGFSVLFKALTNIGVIYFQKELEFNKQFVYQLSGTLADFIIAVPIALILRNVWALVFGLLAANVVRSIVSYLIHPYRPRFSFNALKIKELFGFGKWVMGSSILIFLITQGDDAFVGKFLGATMLGFYQLAYRLSNIPATEITHVISQVTFPAYSKLQDNIPKLREAYLKVLQVTAFLSFPIAGLIFVLAPDFTKIFLGEKWMPMVPAMQILCIFGLIRSFGAMIGPLFHGVGKPNILTKLAFIQLIILMIIIYPLTNRFGIFGTAISVVIPNIITQSIASIYTLSIIKSNFTRFIKPLLFPLISSLIMILFSLFSINIWVVNNITQFIITIIFGVFSYLSMVYLLNKLFNYQIMPILIKSLTGIKKQ